MPEPTDADIDQDFASAIISAAPRDRVASPPAGIGTVSNDPALMRTAPAAALPLDHPDAARLVAEIALLDAAVRHVTATLDFYEEPGHYAAAQRRLA